MQKYEINSETLVILPTEEGNSKVIEENNEFIVYRKVNNIINDSCKYFGSSYDGRKQGSKNILGSSHKLPIILEEINKIVFFPTTSPRNEDCIWISLNLIDEYKRLNKDETIIKFSCGKSIKINVSYPIIDNQVLRSTRLESMYEKRIKKMQKI